MGDAEHGRGRSLGPGNPNAQVRTTLMADPVGIRPAECTSTLAGSGAFTGHERMGASGGDKDS
jgi:hypothetical protein